MSRRAKYDYRAIRETYVTGSDTMTLREAGLKHGVPPSYLKAVYQRAGAEDWEASRHAYRREVSDQTIRQAGSIETEIRTRHMRIARSIIGFSLREFSKLQQMQAKYGDTPLLEMKEVRSMLEFATTLERQAAGLPGETFEVRNLADDERVVRLMNLLSFYAAQTEEPETLDVTPRASLTGGEVEDVGSN